MARKYPRFLFSDPQNTKSQGPFIVHTIKPKFIAEIFESPILPNGIYHVTDGKYDISILDDIEITDEVKNAVGAMFAWAHAQAKAGAIKIHRTPIPGSN